MYFQLRTVQDSKRQQKTGINLKKLVRVGLEYFQVKPRFLFSDTCWLIFLHYILYVWIKFYNRGLNKKDRTGYVRAVNFLTEFLSSIRYYTILRVCISLACFFFILHFVLWWQNRDVPTFGTDLDRLHDNKWNRILLYHYTFYKILHLA